MDPYTILNISRDADDALIRKAYLDGIRRFPAEHASSRFQQIQSAYDCIKDAESRARYILERGSETAHSPFCALKDRVRTLEMHWGSGYFAKTDSFRDYLKSTLAEHAGFNQ